MKQKEERFEKVVKWKKRDGNLFLIQFALFISIMNMGGLIVSYFFKDFLFMVCAWDMLFATVLIRALLDRKEVYWRKIK